MPRVRFEQAVYGSFPFWDRGYAMLAASPGCDPRWLREFESLCQRYGIPSAPPPFSFTGALFAIRLPRRDPWLIVRVAPQGNDNLGRPDALAFHGLFVTPSELRKSPLGPFGLVGALRSQWSAEETTLPPGSWEIPPFSAEEPLPPELDSLREPLTAALVLGRKVALESSEPITLLARAVWGMDPAIPWRVSFATLAGSTAIPFDLVALPRLSSADLTAYLSPELLPAFAARSEPQRFLRIRRWFWPVLGGGLLLLPLVLAASCSDRRDREPAVVATPNPPPPVVPGTIPRNPVATAPIRPASSGPENPDTRAAVAEGLRDFASRYGVPLDPPGDGLDNPSPLIRQIADRLRYRGAFCLDPAFLQHALGPEAQRLADVQNHLLRHFRPERPLPGDLELGPLRWQLETLAWSFDVPLPPALEAAEIPFHLAETLQIPSAPRSVPPDLAQRFPMLSNQSAFVANLPRRVP